MFIPPKTFIAAKALPDEWMSIIPDFKETNPSSKINTKKKKRKFL